MCGTALCPSAIALVKAICDKKPKLMPKISHITKAHSDFIWAVQQIDITSRERRLSIMKAEEALFWILKNLGDTVLGPPK